MPTTKFCTVANVKDYLSTADGYTGDDNALGVHIVAATSLLRVYTRRNWERTARTQLFDSKDIDIALRIGRNLASFTLKEKPLVSVTSVTYHRGGSFFGYSGPRRYGLYRRPRTKSHSYVS